jgi:tetratricopeptide (TPR) repeat protein
VRSHCGSARLGDIPRFGLSSTPAGYRRALRYAPQFLDIRTAGSVYADGLYHDAETVLEEALAQNPRYVDARVTLGLVHWKAGRRARAREAWERCLLDNRDEVRARSYLDFLEREEDRAEEPRAR